MNEARYKELMHQVGMPDSQSIKTALMQVANEVWQSRQPEIDRLQVQLKDREADAKADIRQLQQYMDIAGDQEDMLRKFANIWMDYGTEGADKIKPLDDLANEIHKYLTGQ